MNMQYITLKPGTIILDKTYSKIKRFWCKLIGKELPYNYFCIVSTETDLLKSWDDKNSKPLVIAELKKDYNKKELRQLTDLIDNSRPLTEKGIPYATSYEYRIDDLYTIINAIRPHTFLEREKNLNKIINSKYYLTYMSNEAIDWKNYISGIE